MLLVAILAALITQQNGLIGYVSFLHYLPKEVPILYVSSLTSYHKAYYANDQ